MFSFGGHIEFSKLVRSLGPSTLEVPGKPDSRDNKEIPSDFRRFFGPRPRTREKNSKWPPKENKISYLELLLSIRDLCTRLGKTHSANDKVRNLYSFVILSDVRAPCDVSETKLADQARS